MSISRQNTRVNNFLLAPLMALATGSNTSFKSYRRKAKDPLNKAQLKRRAKAKVSKKSRKRNR